jgi:hypothetical protein
MRILRGILGGALVLVAAAPALGGVGYSVIIESPAPVEGAPTVVRGEVGVQARAEGGIGDATSAAYQARPAGQPWVEKESLSLEPLPGGRFAASEPWSTHVLANGEHDLEVRVWGEVPSYDPDRPGTFARSVLRVVVDNPPLPPRVKATTSVRAVRLRWKDVPTAEREDFLGYRVRTARAKACPSGAEPYTLSAEIVGSDWSDLGAAPGHVCYRVSSVRSSDVTGTIESTMSGPIHVLIRAGVKASVLSTGVTSPPRVASASDAQGPPKQGTYDDTLPFASGGTLAEEAEGGSKAAARRIPGPGRDTAARAAVGLLLLAGALHLRRFLRAPPEGAAR